MRKAFKGKVSQLSTNFFVDCVGPENIPGGIWKFQGGKRLRGPGNSRGKGVGQLNHFSGG